MATMTALALPANESLSALALIMVSRISEELKDAYRSGRKLSEFDGAYDFEERKATLGLTKGYQDLFWRSLAFKLMEFADDGADYIRFQFRKGPYPKTLTDICSDSAVEAYRQEIKAKSRIDRALEDVARQYGQVEMWISLGQPLQQILLEEQVHLNPLIRYCLDVAGNGPRFIRPLASEAKRFLTRYPEYRARLGTRFVEPI